MSDTARQDGRAPRLVHTPEGLDALPDETLVRASGSYLLGGTFVDCWARPLPSWVTGGEGRRGWEVLCYGGADELSLTYADRMAYPVTVLYSEGVDR